MKKNSRGVDPDLISILALLAFGLVAYSNSFTAAFQYDDFHHILRNEAFFDLTDLSRIFHYGKGRFLPYLTLAFNYKISKFDPISYHIFNFFVHYIATIFLYFLFLEIVDTPAMQGVELKPSKRIGAFLEHFLSAAFSFCILSRLNRSPMSFRGQRAWPGCFIWLPSFFM
jgi:hypothetical protein